VSLLERFADSFPPPQGELAGDQIDGLDAVGSLVDGCDAGIAVMLSHSGLLHKAHAAMDLDRHRGHFNTQVGAPRLGDRSEQRHTLLVPLTLGPVGVMAGHVDVISRSIKQTSHGVDVRLHSQKHPTHVGVLNDP